MQNGYGTSRGFVIALFALLAISLWLGNSFFSELQAATLVVDAGDDQEKIKTDLLSGEVDLEGTISSDDSEGTYILEWYGPFGTTTGTSDTVEIPQGIYTVSLQAVGCPESSELVTTEITVSPAFTITPRSKIGVVQLTWTHITGTDHYDVYRAEESDPLSFEKIAETTSTYSTYLDDTVENETNYLYAVSAVDADGEVAFSNIVAACPPESRSTARSNRTPLIYSPAVTTASAGIVYEYTVLAADANSDTITYSLSEAPSGMSIDAETGKIQWTPSSVQSVQVTVTVSDDDGLEDSQAYSIDVTAYSPAVELSTDSDILISEYADEYSPTLSWCATHTDYCIIEPDVGEVDATGSIEVAPSETTEYTITAYGSGGTAADSVTITVVSSVPSPISLQITSPSDGDVIGRQDVMVQGAFSNGYDNITGITVNEVPALIYGNQFVANHVALEEGENTITVTGTDTEGYTATESITVTAEEPADYIRIRAIPESGLSDLEAKLVIDGSFSIENSSLSATAPGEVEYLDVSYGEYTISMSGPGLYFYTAEVEEESVAYTDTVAVQVLDQDELDVQLQTVFDGLKTALAAGDVDTAVEMFTVRSQDKYQEAFEERADTLQQIAADMDEIELIYVYEDMAKYRITRTEEVDGSEVEITYYLYFRIDTDGLWRLEQF